jgi:uncharacterized damage-inducible protein DinB
VSENFADPGSTNHVAEPRQSLGPRNRVQQNPERDPHEWVTGDEPMTGPQASYLQTLCQEAGEAFEPGLTKAQASERIDQLQSVTGRGA